MPGMTCSAFAGSLTDLARNAPIGVPERSALMAHIDVCDRCRSAFDQQVRLSATAAVLAARVGEISAPWQVERAVLSELKTSGRVQRRRFIYGIVGGALAASLAVFWWFASRPEPAISIAQSAPMKRQQMPDAVVTSVRASDGAPRIRRVSQPVSEKASKPASDPEQPFIAIPYTLPLEPYERAAVVRMELPVAALIAAGVPTSLMDPGALAQTDVLVGQDGRARAIRLVSVSTLN